MTPYLITLLALNFMDPKGQPVADKKMEMPALKDLGKDAIPEVIRLRNARPEDVAAAIDGIIDDVIVQSVGSARAVVVNGSADSRKRAREIANQLDVNKLGDVSAGDEPIVVAVRNRDAGQIEGHLARLLGRQGLLVASDRDRGALVMSGPQETLKQAKKLVEQLDAAPRSVSLEFAFLQSGSKSSGEIPNDLADVAKELERFGKTTLMGRLSTMAIEGQKFSVDGGIAGAHQLRVNGQVLNATEQGMIKISIEGQTEMQFPAGENEKGPRHSSYTVRTTLVIAPGVDTVLGVAPCGDAAGQTGILVIRAQ